MTQSDDPTTQSLPRHQLRAMLERDIAPAFGAEVPVDKQREMLEVMGAQAVWPEGVEVTRAPLAGMVADWFIGPGGSTEYTVMHLHGGGYVMGSCGSHGALTARIAVACGFEAVLPEYRLAPQHPCPAALDDAVAAYHALLERGRAPSRIALLGDSAGGGLTLATLLALRDAGAPMPGAAVLLSPWLDMTHSGDSMTTRAQADPWLTRALLESVSAHYRNGIAPSDPRVSPLFSDLSGLPPMLVQVGDHEILLSDSIRFAERARAAGSSVQLEICEELWHVWHLFAPALPEANDALARVGAFLSRTLRVG